MSITVPASQSAISTSEESFAGLKRFVLDFVQGADDPSLLAVAGREINNAINRINSRKWNWSRKSYDITLAESDSDYSLPANYKRPLRMQLLNSSSQVIGSVNYVLAEEFLDCGWPTAGDGNADAYTVLSVSNDRLVRFNRTLSATFIATYPTARHYYFSRVSHFTSESQSLDSLGCPTEFWDFIGWTARASMATIRGTNATSAQQLAEMAWVRLISDDNDVHTDWEYR